ncbi:NUDIX hydrolase [Actinomadura rayongensis]|uniref:NUDIX domain-containing protein n=1 Tax=Actinomadura rayongensis TaxID=1429076 RepID=A0A6I4W288_9ACTN|nr:NUDIX domain-containing protein [Actinomadura rayongensis]MXQ63448.1 NUDIX domain-containing protein [Actinomadura rayongensis]
MNDLRVVAWIHVVNGRLTAVRARGRNLLYLPGGKAEPGEDDREALAREVQEEVSATIAPAAFIELGTIRAEAHDQPNHTHVSMTCYTADHNEPLSPAGEVNEIRYLTKAERNELAPAGRAAWDLAKEKGLLP